MTKMDWVQLGVCLAIAAVVFSRLGKLQIKRSKPWPILAYMLALVGTAVLALGPTIPFGLESHASFSSVTFAVCTLLQMLAGARRWRHGAPPDTDRAPLDDGMTREGELS